MNGSAMLRRDFLAAALAAPGAAALAGPRDDSPADDAPAVGRPPVGVFTKSFQDWPIPKVCAAFAELGVDGLDLTVRPGGHIAPENAAAELPAAVAAAQSEGLKVLFLTTGITDAGPAADRLLGAAADGGVGAVKLGYFRPDGSPLPDRIDAVRRTLAEVAVLAEKRGVTACLHTHSGDYLPSHGTLLYMLLRDLPPAAVGAYVDTLHMHVEGGDAGWRQGLELVAPWLRLCAVKNYRWEPAGRDGFGMRQWKETVVPIADGVSPIPAFVRELKRRGFAGAFSLHSEYRGGSSFENLDAPGVLAQTREDWAFLRGVLDEMWS